MMAARKSKNRSLNTYRRKQKFREPRAHLLIVCEGEKTEPQYFKRLCKKLRLTSAEIRICGKECGSAPISVADYAVQVSKKEKIEAKKSLTAPYDCIWCVMDVEQTGNNPTLPEALQKAKSHDIKVALSNPCFEYWLLWHFEKSDRPFSNCNGVIHRLEQILDRPYRKGDCVFDDGFLEIDKATQRADKFFENREEFDSGIPSTPYTNVHGLVNYLKEVANS